MKKVREKETKGVCGNIESMLLVKSLPVLLLFLAGTLGVHAAEAPIKNAGFVPANIWYSKESFFAGDKIRIYTVIFNGSAEDIVGTVEFLDNGALISVTDFSLASGGRVRDVWADWVAEGGTHIITARITEVSAVKAGGKKILVALENTETGESERFIDLDTDKDGIGNSNDSDDDNDNVSDIDEVKNGTDPLKKDTDGNGILDDEELILAEAQQKKEAVSDAQEGTTENILKIIEEKIPDPIEEAVLSGTNFIERFRVSEGYQARLVKEEKKNEIAAINERDRVLASTTKVSQKDAPLLTTVSDTAEKPFAYVTLALFTLLQYFFEWKIIFYTVVLYCLYRLMKWAIGKIRNR